MPPGGAIVGWEVSTAEPVTLGRVRLVARSGALVVRLPFGGLVWHRPLAVRFEGDGAAGEVAIRDLTRIAQLALYGLALASLVVALVSRSK